jgi:hypothetical protein
MSLRTSIISWTLAVIAGLLAEIIVFAAMPLALRWGPDGPLYVIPPVAFLSTCVAAMGAAFYASSRRVLHGMLVGLVAAGIYAAMTFGQPLPGAYHAAQILKVLGGIAGGYAVRSRLAPRARTA